jgi:hypothetical protein
MSSCPPANYIPAADQPIDVGMARRLLASEGILATGDLFTIDEVAQINAAVNPILVAKSTEERAYAHPDDLLRTGVWDLIFGVRMRSILFSIMPDPVLYHCHVYEIASANPEPHIFGESLAGWHCDVEKPRNQRLELPDEATHVSLFVHLTDIGPGDGAFEFVSAKSDQWLWPGTPCISVFGKAGYTFVWNREFFHRASPNLSNIRRRILKLSIQRNRFASLHLDNEHFRRVCQAVPSGDTEMDILLGRFQGKSAPTGIMPVSTMWTRILPNSNLALPIGTLLVPQLRKRLSRFKSRTTSMFGTSDKAAFRG